MSKKDNNLPLGDFSNSSHPRFTVPVSLFQGINATPYRHISLGQLFGEMVTTDIARLQQSQNLVILYERYLQEAKNDPKEAKENYKKAKELLTGFSMGKWGYRANEAVNCKEYVSCLVLDIDACQSTYEVFLLQQKLAQIPYIFASFPSPSGYGLRILVWTNATFDTHQIQYLQLLKALGSALGVTTQKNDKPHFDTSCKNESRFFYYVAVNPKNFYLNPDSTVWIPETPENVGNPPPVSPPVKSNGGSPKHSGELMEWIEEINDEVKIEYLYRNLDKNKPRKLQCFDFGCVCAENQVNFERALSFAQQQFWDSENKNPENVVTQHFKGGYEHSSTRYTDAQFAAFLNKVFGIKVRKYAHGNHTSEKTHSTAPFPAPAKSKEWIQPVSDSDSLFEQMEKKLQKIYEFRKNTLSQELEMREKRTGENFSVVTEEDLHNFLRFLAKEEMMVSQKNLETSLYSNYVPHYNPLEEYFKTLPVWDKKTDWIKKFADFVISKDQEWFEHMFRKMLVRSIACGFGKKENKHCFTLIGGQNNGKTSWIRYLCPPTLQRYFKENFKTDKDGIIALSQNWFILLDELDRMRKEIFEDLKAAFSMQFVKERPPYGRLPIRAPRIANFFATANKRELLTDETGSVRWIVIEILNILRDKNGQKGYRSINIDEVWAQAYHLYQTGFEYDLTDEEIALLNTKNENYKRVYIEMELLNQYYKVPDDTDRLYAIHQTSASILIRLQKISSINHLKLSNIRKALGEMGFHEKYYRPNGNGYMVVEIT